MPIIFDMASLDESSELELPDRVAAWRTQIGALESLLGVTAQRDVDFDTMMLVGGTSSMVRLVAADRCSPEDIRPVATLLAEARDRQLEELGEGLAVNAIMICDSDAVSRESYRICEALGVELICFDDTYDRPRLAQIVTARPEDLPSTSPAVHASHQSDAEQQAEMEAILAEDDGAAESVAEWIREIDEEADSTMVEDLEEVDELGVPRSMSWNDEHPYELRIFFGEEPDFEMPPIDLRGVSGAALAERKLQIARAYLGFDAEYGCPLMLEGDERLFFLLSGSGLVEYKKPPRAPSSRGRSLRVGAVSRITSGTYLSMSTRVGPTAADTPPTDEVLTPVDDGDIVITSRRVAFVGERMNREWRFDRLLATRVDTLHVEGLPTIKTLMMSTSNRAKVSGFYLEADLVSTIQFILELARCQCAEDRQKLVRSLDAGKTVGC